MPVRAHVHGVAASLQQTNRAHKGTPQARQRWGRDKQIARGGAVRFKGEDVTGVPAHEIVRRGLAQAPEGRKIFPRLTVLENLEMGAFTRTDRPGVREDIEHSPPCLPSTGGRTCWDPRP